MKSLKDSDFSTLLKDAAPSAGTQTDNPYYAGDVLSIPTDKVQPRAQQVRAELKHIEELANSIKASAQQQPIVVDPMNADGVFFIQKGQRRWAACKHLGIEVLAVVREAEEGTAEIVGQLAENIQRDALTPFETAAALNAIVNVSGAGQKAIAGMIGKHRGYVGRHLRIANGPADLLSRCQDNTIGDSVLIDELIKLHTLNPKIALKLLNKEVSRKEVTNAIKKQQGLKSPRSNKTAIKPVIGHHKQACKILKRTDDTSVLIQYLGSKKQIKVSLSALRILQC